MRFFLHIAAAQKLEALGRASDRFMSYGNYPVGGERLFRYGGWQQSLQPLEQTLVNAPVRAGESTPVAAQHVVRSFDPCMVCTVH